MNVYSEMTESAYWFVFCKDELLLKVLSDGTCEIPLSKEPPIKLAEWNKVHKITPLNDINCYAVSIDNPVTGFDGYCMCGLRSSFDRLELAFYLKAGKAAEILYWDKNTKFCGLCGAPMKLHTDISKRCINCGKEVWPQLATAIIVLIKKGEDEVLLVHPHNIKGDYYGLVAGFVETGETLEECVSREVMEEVGISVANIKYFASQPWPYPCGLMIGFTADYVSGTVRFQRSELAYGGWFHYSSLPPIPPKLSLARMLIDAWLEDKINPDE